LFAALNVVSGKVSGQCYPRHRHQEFIKFLRRLDTEFEPDLELHLIMDNYGTHKHEKVRCFLELIGASKFITSQPVQVGST
jgi:transposase